MTIQRSLVRVLLTIGVATTNAVAAEEPRNWFDDPFFQVTAQVRGCPVPRGPVMTRSEMEREAHARVERGTRCYMDGQCARPNSYRYDAPIASALQAALAAGADLAGTSLWVTVQRRWVWLQGCVASPARVRRLVALVRNVPDVERVFVEVMADPKRPPAYATAPRPAVP